MALTVYLKADFPYDSVDRLETALFQAMISPKDFSVNPLGGSAYEIKLSDPPDNYRGILEQWGKLCHKTDLDLFQVSGAGLE